MAPLRRLSDDQALFEARRTRFRGPGCDVVARDMTSRRKEDPMGEQELGERGDNGEEHGAGVGRQAAGDGLSGVGGTGRGARVAAVMASRRSVHSARRGGVIFLHGGKVFPDKINQRVGCYRQTAIIV